MCWQHLPLATGDIAVTQCHCRPFQAANIWRQAAQRSHLHAAPELLLHSSRDLTFPAQCLRHELRPQGPAEDGCTAHAIGGSQCLHLCTALPSASAHCCYAGQPEHLLADRPTLCEARCICCDQQAGQETTADSIEASENALVHLDGG